MKLELSRQILEKYSNINFIKLHPVGSELFNEDGRTDRRDRADSLLSQFCELDCKKEYRPCNGQDSSDVHIPLLRSSLAYG
jgi:hypothetical protein